MSDWEEQIYSIMSEQIDSLTAAATIRPILEYHRPPPDCLSFLLAAAVEWNLVQVVHLLVQFGASTHPNVSTAAAQRGQMDVLQALTHNLLDESKMSVDFFSRVYAGDIKGRPCVPWFQKKA